MRFKRRLRARIIISFLIFGTLLSGLFALTALGMRQYLQNALIDQTLITDLKNHIDSIQAGTTSQRGFFSSRYFAYLGRPERTREGLLEGFPEDEELHQRITELLALPNGIHEIRTRGHVYKIAVDKRPIGWGYVVYDATPNPRENLLLFGLLGGAGVFFSVLALILAIWSSERVMAPVSDLAKRISTLGDSIHPEPLAPAYADDEVGQLARALDEYADRLTALVVRDKEFNADVSHELRTPLSVIKSATELLLAQADIDERTRTRLQRIERAAKQSAELTEALLHLVRGERVDRSTGEYFRVDKIVEEVVDFKRFQIGTKPVDVHVKVNESFLVCAPESVIAVALGNLIGNAFKYTHEGRVDITVGRGRVVVEDTGPGLAESEMQQVFNRHYRGSTARGKGSGLGLTIVRRFCELYEWTVDIGGREGGGLRATLSFGNVG